MALLTEAEDFPTCGGDGLGGDEGRGIDIGSCDMSWSNVARGEDEELPHRTMGGGGIGGTVMIIEGPEQLQSGGAAGIGVEDEEQAGSTGGGGGGGDGGTGKKRRKGQRRKYCVVYRQTGSCDKGEGCLFRHGNQ